MILISTDNSVSLRPEAELLLCCARTRMDSEKAARIRVLLQHDIDWEYLFRTASEHGIAPLLYRHLNAICPEAVPKETLDQAPGPFSRQQPAQPLSDWRTA